MIACCRALISTASEKLCLYWKDPQQPRGGSIVQENGGPSAEWLLVGTKIGPSPSTTTRQEDLGGITSILPPREVEQTRMTSLLSCVAVVKYIALPSRCGLRIASGIVF